MHSEEIMRALDSTLRLENLYWRASLTLTALCFPACYGLPRVITLLHRGFPGLLLLMNAAILLLAAILLISPCLHLYCLARLGANLLRTRGALLRLAMQRSLFQVHARCLVALALHLTALYFVYAILEERFSATL
ncbi:MAG: hypothetical protein Q4G03_02805 [Planctomycetia bacterium]|nr:hypothetical protein [Planctomycetia bacterium]